MKITRHANCEKCQLYNKCLTPWMESDGADNPLILIVGEAPGESEDNKGRPFIGKSGQLLRETLDAIGVESQDVRFTNVVRCRPPDNKISKKFIDNCKHYVDDEIKFYDPQIVLLMGNSPLSAVLGETGGISQWNGVSVERDGTTYAPLFHPAYVLRNMNMFEEWAKSMSDAITSAGEVKHKSDYRYPKTVKDVKAMERALFESEWISYDVETASLDPFADHNILVSVSFSNGEASWSLPLEHPDAPWSEDELYTVAEIICKILCDHNGKVIGHNIKFDQQHTRQIIDCQFDAGGDSMLLSYIQDSRRGIHGLKRLAGLYLGMFDYDRKLNEYIKEHKEANPRIGGSYAAIPLDVLLPYGAMDADATYRLYWKLWGELPEEQHSLARLLVMASNTLARMEYNGAAIDTFIADRYVQIYQMEQQRLYNMICEDRHVKKMVTQKQQEHDDSIAGTKRRRQIYQFNPNSINQLQELYFQRYKIPPVEMTDSGNPSTKATVIKIHAEKYPIIDLVRHYKLMTKMLGTYLRPALDGKWASGDGRVRSSYNIHGTRTGRLSSSDPNLQNIPTPEKEPGTLLEILPIKNVFTHSHWSVKPSTTFPARPQIINGRNLYSDGVLMSVDYSGMELRVFASLANCLPMIEIHKSGADFHSMVAIMAMTGRDVSTITKDEANKFKSEHKDVRYRYKWTNWTLLYGGDENTLIHMYGMTRQEAEDTVNQYYGRFPEVLEYRKWAKEFAEDNGYIVSPFGRREHLPYIRDRFNVSERNKAIRSAVNMPVQSAASDTLVCALTIIDKYLNEGKWRTKLVNTVHDSIVLDVPYDEVQDIAHLCTDVMESIVLYSKTHLPFINFEWLICPLKADVDVGTHYGAEVSYKDWISGKVEL